MQLSINGGRNAYLLLEHANEVRAIVKAASLRDFRHGMIGGG